MRRSTGSAPGTPTCGSPAPVTATSSDDEAGEVADGVRAARPDILFVAISSPKKEYWLSRYGREIDVPFVMGVGGSVDVLAGQTRRAPRPPALRPGMGSTGWRRSRGGCSGATW